MAKFYCKTCHKFSDGEKGFVELHAGHELFLRREDYLYFLDCTNPQGNYNAVGSVLNTGRISWR